MKIAAVFLFHIVDQNQKRPTLTALLLLQEEHESGEKVRREISGACNNS